MDSKVNGHPLSPLRGELGAIAARFEDADRRAKAAQVHGHEGEQAAAETERREAEGKFRAAEEQLADLFFLLLRCALRHRREALEAYLLTALDPQFDALADSIARMEGR